jgi:hypothetical protein
VAHDDITLAPPKISTATSLSIGAGANHRRRRFGEELLVEAVKEVPSMTEKRALERQLKRKKNPRLAISALN